MGSDITPEHILSAYAIGVFPMAERGDDEDFFWVDPPLRGIIPLEEFRVSASLLKFLRKKPFDVRINCDFDSVIAACAAPAKDRDVTWINPAIRKLYCDLHRMGFAHSIECYEGEQLVGGLYGIALRGAFFGESMFSRKTNASKTALVHLVTHLRARGYALLDCQFVNPHLVQFGCIEIPRDEYHSRLSAALALEDVSFVEEGAESSSAIYSSSAASVGDGGSGAGGFSWVSSGFSSDWDAVLGSLQSRTVTS